MLSVTRLAISPLLCDITEIEKITHVILSNGDVVGFKGHVKNGGSPATQRRYAALRPRFFRSPWSGLSRSEREQELRKEKVAHTQLLVSTVGKGVAASAWKKKTFVVPNEEHLVVIRGHDPASGPGHVETKTKDRARTLKG